MTRKLLFRTLPALLAMAALSAHAQYFKLHGASISAGGTGQFSTELDPQNGSSNGQYNFNTPAGPEYGVEVINQKQYTTDSAGFVTSFQFHPVAWAGLELNYGYTRYSERYGFNYGLTPTVPRMASVRTDMHEATGAYSFHPRHVPFQPFLNVGGGAVDFAPFGASNQWRGAGLLELGFDIPTPNKHIGFRIEGRSLYYRAPNFYTSAISTTTWRATEEPSVSTYYRF